MSNTPDIFIEGIDVVIKRDLDKHKSLLERAKLSLISFREGVSHEVKRKRHYLGLINEGKYDEESMRASIEDIKINIRHLSDKSKLAQDEIDHHCLIVETLTTQLEEYNDAARNRCV